jgi:phenylacetate-CoA ligase
MLKNGGVSFLPYINQKIGTYLRKNIIFPFYWKYIKHSNVLSCYKVLRNHQWNTLEENKKIQRKKLYKLIKYASQNIPYCKKIIKEHNMQFSESTIFDDIKKFPILTKDVIRNHFDKLYKFRDHTYYRNFSGGSTGEPVIFYQDSDCFAWNTATKILFDEWAGRKIGEPMVKLWGSIQDILKGGQGFKEYLRQQLSGVITLSSAKVSEEDMHRYLKTVNKIKPGLILAYAHFMGEFTRFIQNHDLPIYSPRAVMTSACVLFPEIRKNIEDVFQTTLFNRYGSREVGNIACNCDKSIGLHLIPDIHYLEIVDDEGREVKVGESGNIIITLLTNYTMPLIRYKIGDRGVLYEKNGLCRHGLPFLEKIEGRIVGHFKNKFGDIISGGFFFAILLSCKNIKQFQIIQEEIEFISINLVLIDKTKLKNMKKDFKEINKKIKLAMGNSTKIKYNIGDEIKPSSSGKHLYSYSKTSN